MDQINHVVWVAGGQNVGLLPVMEPQTALLPDDFIDSAILSAAVFISELPVRKNDFKAVGAIVSIIF